MPAYWDSCCPQGLGAAPWVRGDVGGSEGFPRQRSWGARGGDRQGCAECSHPVPSLRSHPRVPTPSFIVEAAGLVSPSLNTWKVSSNTQTERHAGWQQGECCHSTVGCQLSTAPGAVSSPTLSLMAGDRGSGLRATAWGSDGVLPRCTRSPRCGAASAEGPIPLPRSVPHACIGASWRDSWFGLISGDYRFSRG